MSSPGLTLVPVGTLSVFEAVTVGPTGANGAGTGAGAAFSPRASSAAEPTPAPSCTEVAARIAALFEASASGATWPTSIRYERAVARKTLALWRLGFGVKSFLNLLG